MVITVIVIVWQGRKQLLHRDHVLIIPHDQDDEHGKKGHWSNPKCVFVLKLALLQDPDKTPRARRHCRQGAAGPGGAQEPPEHGAPSPPGV